MSHDDHVTSWDTPDIIDIIIINNVIYVDPPTCADRFKFDKTNHRHLMQKCSIQKRFKNNKNNKINNLKSTYKKKENIKKKTGCHYVDISL